MSKKRRLHPLELAAKNASFNILGYIRKKYKEALRKAGTMNEEYYTETYITEWKDKDNVIISMWLDDRQVGVVELAVHKHGEHEGEALVWNLYIDAEHRGKGLARRLMDEARKTAKHLGAKTCVLEWSIEESPQWVFDWYTRLGYDEKEFGPGCALMKRPLTTNK